MSPANFNMPLTEITWADIEALVSEQIEEGQRLELKGEFDVDAGGGKRRDSSVYASPPGRLEDAARSDILKAVVAFANAYGGVLVVGIDDDGLDRAVRIGRLVPSCKDLAESIGRMLADKVDPPLPVVEVLGVEAPDTSHAGVIVIRVGSSRSAPHGYGTPPRAYVRRDKNSEPLTMRDMQNLFFEARARSERARSQLSARSAEFAQLVTRWSSGAYPEEKRRVIGDWLAFRATLVPVGEVHIDNPWTFARSHLDSRPTPRSLEGQEISAPAFGKDQFGYHWEPRAGHSQLNETTDRFSAVWRLFRDGSLEVVGMRPFVNGQHTYAGWFGVTTVQLMVLCCKIRRLAMRPDVEYALECEWRSSGQVTAIVELDRFNETVRRIDAGSLIVGQFSVGTDAEVPRVAGLIWRELFHSLGLPDPIFPIDVATMLGSTKSG